MVDVKYLFLLLGYLSINVVSDFIMDPSLLSEIVSRNGPPEVEMDI